MNIVITGVAGLLGCHLSRHLLSKGYTIIGIDNFFGGYKDFLPEHDNFYFYERNLENDNITDIYEKHKPVATFHFAAYAAEGLSPFIRKFNYTNNVLASANIINECINNESKLIFTSSMAVYGDQKPPFDEKMLPKPIDPYGIAKYAVEMDIKQANEQFGLKYNIVRPHNVLGIYQNIWDKYRNVIGIFIRRVLDGDPIIVYGDGEQTRAFSDISYYMDPFLKLIEDNNNEIYNIGADKYFTINEVANIVKKVGNNNGYNAEIMYGEPRHEVKHAFCNHNKAIEDLSFKDETDIYKLINEMFLWASKQEKRNIKKMSYEVEKNIYEYWK